MSLAVSISIFILSVLFFLLLGIHLGKKQGTEYGKKVAKARINRDIDQRGCFTILDNEGFPVTVLAKKISDIDALSAKHDSTGKINFPFNLEKQY